jgi:multidrug transporter EmrE-like cation transporter
MTIGPGDTISVAADTLNLPLPKAEYSIGSIIPLVTHPDEMTVMEDHAGVLTADYISRLRRIDGEPRPRETVNSDMSFIVLSLSLLLITLMTVFGRRSIFSGLSSISFRRREETVPAGTSEVFSWPPILRNIFTVLNAGLFTSTALLVPGLADIDLLGGSTGLTAVLAGSFLAALLLRHLTSMILASITGLKNQFREYMNVVYNIWFAFSAVLFVLNGIILFAPLKNPLPFITAGLIVVAIFLLIRVLKLLSIFHDRHITIFYFLLYLCALEVLPVLVTLKILGVF